METKAEEKKTILSERSDNCLRKTDGSQHSEQSLVSKKSSLNQSGDMQSYLEPHANKEVFLISHNSQEDRDTHSNYQRTNLRTMFGSVLEQESEDHYLNSQMDKKRSVMGLLINSLQRKLKLKTAEHINQHTSVRLESPTNGKVDQKQSLLKRTQTNLGNSTAKKLFVQELMASVREEEKFGIGTPKYKEIREGQDFSFMRQGRDKITEMIKKDRSFVTHSFGLTTEKTQTESGESFKMNVTVSQKPILSEEQKLLIAIVEDDVLKFQQIAFSTDQITQMKFESDMNVLNLAIDSSSSQIIKYLGALLNQTVKSQLVEHEFQGIRAVHQAISLGDRKVIQTVIVDFKADMNTRSSQDITIVHFAAQNYRGFLSLQLLKEDYSRKFILDIDIRSGLLATPLHFAVIFRCLKNVELLIKYNANVNLQDREGRTPLHIAVIRLISQMSQSQQSEDQDADESDEIYEEYKLIIKELLFNGADRMLTTKDNQTPKMILHECRDVFTEKQFISLDFILGQQSDSECLMRFRPIRKVKKSSKILILAILLNLVICYLFYYGLRMFTVTPRANFFPKTHFVLVWGSVVAFVFLIPTYVISAKLDPGYIAKKFNFIDLTEEFLDNNLDLINLCTYDEVIKSETSFHCMFCGRCVEFFDHHCPFINNCLGYRNHKYFLVFIFSYFIFIVIVALETIRHVTEIFTITCASIEPVVDKCTAPCELFNVTTPTTTTLSCILQPRPKNIVGWYSITILVLIGINIPIIFYQVYIQLRQLCKYRPVATKAPSSTTAVDDSSSFTKRRQSIDRQLNYVPLPEQKQSSCICCTNLCNVCSHQEQTQEELRRIINCQSC